MSMLTISSYSSQPFSSFVIVTKASTVVHMFSSHSALSIIPIDVFLLLLLQCVYISLCDVTPYSSSSSIDVFFSLLFSFYSRAMSLDVLLFPDLFDAIVFPPCSLTSLGRKRTNLRHSCLNEAILFESFIETI